MLAIARALLFNPMLLVMDEPTEGLAPVIVQQVAEMLKRLAADGSISVLLIEQNLGVAIDVADTVDVMVNGRIARSMPSAELAADRDLQQRLLGVKVGVDEEPAATRRAGGRVTRPDTVTVYTVRRSSDEVRDRRRPRAGAARRARGARLHALERGGSPERAARPPDRRPRGPGRARCRRSTRRPRALADSRLGRAGGRVPGGRHRRSGRPTSRAPSTPRDASCSSCGTAWTSSACGRSRWTWRPPASRRPR